jgi:spore germination cell wall hydrolase CwlJ-like protein
MTAEDITLTATTAYRENRGGGMAGMASVVNVVMNRAKASGHTPYTVCTTHAQFSSISVPGPEAYLWPKETDPDWIAALTLAAQAAADTLTDLTQGATLYYAPKAIETTARFVLPGGESVPFPKDWNAAVVRFTVKIANQLFFTES